MNLSIKSFIYLCLVAIFASGALVTISVWQSADHATRTAELLRYAVEDVASAQRIQQALNEHRRQPLLAGIRSIEERRQRIQDAKASLLVELDKINSHVITKEESKLVAVLHSDITSYLDSFNQERSKGVRSHVLYESVGDEFYKAQDGIQKVINLNLQEANDLQNATAAQTRQDFLWLIFSLGLLGMVVVSLVFGSNRLIYRPVIRLKNMISDFEVGAKVQVPNVNASSEIQSIIESFSSMAERLQQQKNQQLTFLSGIAHDLKNPLGAIKMSMELLNEEGGLNSEQQEMLSIVSRQTDHLTNLISDLLDTTRIEAGTLALESTVTDMRDLLRDTVKLHQNLSKNHVLELSLPNSPLMVMCDRHRMSQVLNNLLSNAIKYSPEGGKVKIEACTSADKIIVKVQDQGIGILPQDLEGIFEPFKRSSNTRETIPGVGLGLSVAKKIVMAHQGEIKVESQSQKGTIFTVSLKRYENTQSAEVPAGTSALSF